MADVSGWGRYTLAGPVTYADVVRPAGAAHEAVTALVPKIVGAHPTAALIALPEMFVLAVERFKDPIIIDTALGATGKGVGGLE